MSRRSLIVLATALLALALIASGAIAAEGGAGNGPKQHGMQMQGMTLQKFATVLGLTDQQTADVKAILDKLQTDLKAVRESNKTKEEKMAAVKELRATAKTAIYAILTAEQKQKADERRLVDKLLSPMRKPLMQCLATLNLTEDQKAKIKGFVKDAEDQAKVVRKDTSLTPEAKKAKLKEIHQAMLDKVKSVLTAEQQQKLDDCLKKHARQGGPKRGDAAGTQCPSDKGA